LHWQAIRKTAIPLMQYLVGRFFKDARAAPYQLSVTSVLPTTYQQSQVSQALFVACQMCDCTFIASLADFPRIVNCTGLALILNGC
jgi:hypothetical protein